MAGRDRASWGHALSSFFIPRSGLFFNPDGKYFPSVCCLAPIKGGKDEDEEEEGEEEEEEEETTCGTRCRG